MKLSGPLEVAGLCSSAAGVRSATCNGGECPVPPQGFTNGTSFTSLTGVMGYGFSLRMLYPRQASDFGQ